MTFLCFDSCISILLELTSNLSRINAKYLQNVTPIQICHYFTIAINKCTYCRSVWIWSKCSFRMSLINFSPKTTVCPTHPNLTEFYGIFKLEIPVQSFVVYWKLESTIILLIQLDKALLNQTCQQDHVTIVWREPPLLSRISYPYLPPLRFFFNGFLFAWRLLLAVTLCQ